MLEDKGKIEAPIELRTGSAVTPPTRNIDIGNMLATITTGGLAVWLVVTQIPEMVKSIGTLEKAVVTYKDETEKHFRAISDDRRVQFDQIRTDLTEMKHNISELRRVSDRTSSRPESSLPKSVPSKGP